MDGKKKRVTLICSRNTLDGVYPPLILALNAVRAGAEAMVFFTFQGLDVVTKEGYRKIKFYPPGMFGVIPGLPALATRTMYRLAEERANIPS
ncbi:MAG: DsrE/DsrF/DrsH-like family protein, partial [Firmicutes bacterium]|nr:DsrE/DsrF/DrsH-like family protein [Bacillota bacterium]